MNNMQYKKSGATVSVSQTGAAQVYKIEREGGKVLKMSFTRTQNVKSENFTLSMGGGSAPAIKGDYVASYDVGVSIDEEKRNFSVSFEAKHFEGFGYVEPDYKVSLENGIPAEEYGKVCEELSKQNTAVAQVMKDYVLDADGLQKANNLQQSAFNKKLDEFLSK